jgi:hypothetical protein
LIIAAVAAAALFAGPTYVIPPDQAAYVHCVAERESHSNPKSTNRAHGYFGMFQFSDALSDGAAWMMIPWLSTWHPHPRQFAAQLRATEMHKWPANLQIAAMLTVLNARGKWSGAHHWAGGRYTCTPGKQGK